MLKEGSTAVQQWGYRHCVSHVWNSSYFYCFQREKQSDKVPCGKQQDSLHSDKQQKVLCCQWVAHTNAERIFLWKEETIQMHITLCISLVTNPCCPGLWRQFWHSIKSLLLLSFFFPFHSAGGSRFLKLKKRTCWRGWVKGFQRCSCNPLLWHQVVSLDIYSIFSDLAVCFTYACVTLFLHCFLSSVLSFWIFVSDFRCTFLPNMLSLYFFIFAFQQTCFP